MSSVESTPVAAPVARPEPRVTNLHGVTLTDDYAWLRDKTSPETLAYLNAENAFTDAAMVSTFTLQKKLYDEMLSHIKETDESVPYLMKAFFYYTRTVAGQQYPIHCRRLATGLVFDENQPEEILLDVNKLAEGQPFMSVGGMAISVTGTLLAYSTDNTGFRQYTLHIRDLSTGLDLTDTALRVGSLVWAADSKTLFYTTEDEVTKRHDHLFRHTLGTATADDVLVFHEPDERFNLGVGKTRDGKYLLLESGSHTTNEYQLLAADTPEAAFELIAPRLDDQEYYPEHRNGTLYIRTNDTGRNFRLVTTALKNPGREHWQELLAMNEKAPLEDFDLFQTFLVTSRRELGLPVMDVFRFTEDDGRSSSEIASSTPERSLSQDTSSRPKPSESAVDTPTRPQRILSQDTSSRPDPERSEGKVERTPHLSLSSPTRIAFPEPTYSAGPHVNREFDTTKFRYSYQSLVSPASVYEYDTATSTSTLLKMQDVPGGFDPALYASERVMITASDGVQVPVTLVYRRDTFKRDASSPLYVYGYGSYGYALPVSFSGSRLSLLDRGLVLAYAHIRGGGRDGRSMARCGQDDAEADHLHRLHLRR